MASLKTELDKLDIAKLLPVPAGFSKLSDVVKNDVVRSVYDKLVTKVNNMTPVNLFQKLNTRQTN